MSDELESSTTNENEIKRTKSKRTILIYHLTLFCIFLAIDKSQLMKNVVFVLSGFQNPLRSELRNKATAMGGIYNDDWDETCTHLMYD
jgi:hypothetical protein